MTFGRGLRLLTFQGPFYYGQAQVFIQEIIPIGCQHTWASNDFLGGVRGVVTVK